MPDDNLCGRERVTGQPCPDHPHAEGDLRDRIAEALTRAHTNGLCPAKGPCVDCDCFTPGHPQEHADADVAMTEITTELERLNDRLQKATVAYGRERDRADDAETARCRWKARGEQAERVLRDLGLDDEPCWFDHHGGCQAHGYPSLKEGQRCPHAEAKELLASLAPAGNRETANRLTDLTTSP